MDGLAEQVGVTFVDEVNHRNLPAEAFGKLGRNVEEVGCWGAGADDALPLVYAVGRKRQERVADEMPRTLRAANDEVADVRVGDNVADDLLDSDVLGLERAGQGGSGFDGGADKAFDFRRRLFAYPFEDDAHGDRRVVVAAKVAALFGWVSVRRVALEDVGHHTPRARPQGRAR